MDEMSPSPKKLTDSFFKSISDIMVLEPLLLGITKYWKTYFHNNLNAIKYYAIRGWELPKDTNVNQKVPSREKAKHYVDMRTELSPNALEGAKKWEKEKRRYNMDNNKPNYCHPNEVEKLKR